ncbi:MAG: hypothetical protein ACK6CU_19950 [Deltaproteobacteria bacterium]|jgi:hypothetical protein
MTLRPCSSCARHIRATENACPFCHAVLEPSPTTATGPSVGRLGRAALFAFGAAATTAALATATEGCSSPTTPADASAAIDSGGPGPLYGGPPDTGATDAGATETDAGTTDAGTADAGTADAGTADPDAGGPGPLYGGPPDGGVAPPYGAPSEDAGVDAGGGVAPLYGGSPGQ